MIKKCYSIFIQEQKPTQVASDMKYNPENNIHTFSLLEILTELFRRLPAALKLIHTKFKQN